MTRGIEGFSPCPACENIGFTIQVWNENDEQMMQCPTDDCRVEEYRMIHA
jgi:Zn ribbon nucleic-acid-binding protein